MDPAFGQWLFGQAAVVVVLVGFIWLLVVRGLLATTRHLDDLRSSNEGAWTRQEKTHAEARAELMRTHADAIGRLDRAHAETVAQLEKRIEAADRNADLWREVARTGVITAREAVSVAANHAGATPPTSPTGGAA